MKKSILIVAGIITLGISASVFNSSAYSITTSELSNQEQTETYTPRSFRNNTTGRMNNSINGGFHRGMMGNSYSSEEFTKYRGSYGSTCHRNSNYSIYEGQEKLSIEEIKEQVLAYMTYYYGKDFSIGDIFEFDSTDYYVSIEESSTGRGAFELLVNPYTGDVRHEQGPNMMWNIKYGMMNDITGYNYTTPTTQEISLEEAVNLANDYLQAYQIDGTVSAEGNHFYGYYTLHIEKNDNVIGMVSVNAYTGEPWIHGWHDNVVNMYTHDKK